MSQQIQISGGAKVRNLQDVIIGTSGVLSSLAFDVANGVPRLDVNGKILVSQLPNSVMEYKGTWNAATNTPTLANGTGNQGDVYLCNVAGTVDFGAGAIAFFVGDQVIYSGSIWQRASGATGTVTSVAVTESGDSLNITGSPITTSGTINIGFNGTNLQYVNGAGNLTTFPILTGFVPYTGATQNVDLGVFDLTADLITGATGSFASNGGSDTFAINHSSGAGIALNITKGGNGEGLYINKTSGSGNAATIIGTLNATTLVKNGGTSSQFLKADGTVDSNTYALDSLVVHLAGTETITGAKTFSGYTTFTSTVDITSGLTFSNSGFTLLLQPPTLSVNRTVTLPNGTGTLALTSDLSNYVDLTTAQTISGVKTFSSSILSSGIGFFSTIGGTNYGGIVGTPTYFQISAGGGSSILLKADNGTNAIIINTLGKVDFGSTIGNGTYTYTLPSATGTIALVGGSGVGTVTSVAALTIGTSGTDLSSSVANSTTTPVITLNVPTASATNRGALSSADWTTFNNKQSALTNPITGTGTSNLIAKFNGSTTLTNSLIEDNGSVVGINGAVATHIFQIYSGTTNYARVGITNTSTGNTFGDGLIFQQETINSIIKNQENGYLAFGVNGSETNLVIAQGGKVGIGTASPQSTFVVGVTADTQGCEIDNATSGVPRIFAFNRSGGVSLPLALQSVGGNVLIGTTTDAGQKLQVNGTALIYDELRLRSSSYGASYNTRLTSDSSANGILQLGNNNINYILAGNTAAGGYLVFRVNCASESITAGTLALTLASTGAATFSSSVTAGGTGEFSINDGSSTWAPIITMTNNSAGANDYAWGKTTVNDLSLRNLNNGYYAITFQNQGTYANVGLGETTPNCKLDVVGLSNASNTYGIITARNSSDGGISFGASSTSYVWIQGNVFGAGVAPIALNANGGNVLIGTTTDNGYKLYVDGGSSNGMAFYSTSPANQFKIAGSAAAMTFSNTISAPSMGGSLGVATSAGDFLSGTAAGDTIFINQFSGKRLYAVSYSGGVYLSSGATSWTANSDIRLKNINSHIENAVEKLSTLQTINFSYKDDKTNKQNLGLIAQEVEKIFPELIDKNGDGMLGVRYTELVPVLIKAVQELKLEIETLKNK